MKKIIACELIIIACAALLLVAGTHTGVAVVERDAETAELGRSVGGKRQRRGESEREAQGEEGLLHGEGVGVGVENGP